ncbi:MAG: DUF4190 domain-containing protein [Verrucomicrobiota bacterium]|jgi:hypothetical protein
MSATYKIIGEDGKEYGPVSGELVRRWIAEGRVESRTPVFVDGAKDWNYAGLLPEFANYFAPTIPPAIAMPGQPPKTNSYATAGLVCSILAWICCCGFPFNLLGLVFSLVALSQINRHPELYEGRGLAIAGLVLSFASLLLTLGAVLWGLAFNPPAFQWNFKSF